MTFSKVFTFEVEYTAGDIITKYVSNKTKLQVVHIYSPSSNIVESQFVVKTGDSTRSLLPHAVEKLVMASSEKYPFRKLFEIAKDICYSIYYSICETEYTLYSLSTPSWGSFQKMFPLYMDHLFHPLMTQEYFTTEIYHIDPDTLEDKGFLFKQLEDNQSYPMAIMNLESKLEFMSGDKGDKTRFQSGMDLLLDSVKSLNLKDIQEFHKRTYTPDKTCLTIKGNISEEELFKVIDKLDESFDPYTGELLLKVNNNNNNSVIAFRNSNENIIEKLIKIPEEEEKNDNTGEMKLFWIGPSYAEDTLEIALMCLLEYFRTLSSLFFENSGDDDNNNNDTDNDSYRPNSPYLTFGYEHLSKSIHSIWFENINICEMSTIKEKVLSLLSSHVIDIGKMLKIVETMEDQYTENCGLKGFFRLPTKCTEHFIYGGDDSNGEILQKDISTLHNYKTIKNFSQKNWQDLLDTWFVRNKPFVVKAEKSYEYYEQLNETKRSIIRERKANCDVEKLKEVLDRANKEMATPIPKEVRSEFQQDVSSFFIKGKRIVPISSIGGNENNDSDDLVHKVLSKKPK